MTEVVKNVETAVKAAAAREAVTDMFFVACGGSNALLMSGHYAVEREAEKIASFSYSSAEFLARAPRRLGKGSVVILCSHSGNTPETVAAALAAQKVQRFLLDNAVVASVMDADKE